jgi:transposase
MDKLFENETTIKKKIYNSTVSAFKEKIDVAFFDVTTLYFESFNQDDLRCFGFSKDCKFKEVQVVLALMATTGGMPLGYELFAGNKSEGKTLIECIKKFKVDYEIQNVFLVADRAMFTEDNLAYMESEKIKYIVAAKLKSQKKALKDEILLQKEKALSVAQERQIEEYTHEIKHEKGRRFIVNYSLKRANKDKADRNRLVERIKKVEKNGIIDLKKLIKNSGSKKYLKITKPTNSGVLNLEKIANDSKWDGLHGVIVNDPEISMEAALERYRGLWQIEAAFRLKKNDLKMRPIFHWKPNRIRAHVLFCYICYTVVVNTSFRMKEKNLNLSFARAKEELSRVRASILINKKNGQKYLLPKTLNDLQKKIYETFEIPYSTSAKKID